MSNIKNTKMIHFMDDKVQMQWGDSGFGYGCGDKYIITAFKDNNKLCGDITVFSADDGQIIMKAEYANGVPHGMYTVYHNGNISEEGISKNGCIVFHARRINGTLVEYGQIKNGKLHGNGVVIDQYGTVFRSPHWQNGVINGLASVQDKNGDVVYYGKFRNHFSQCEVDVSHPFLVDTYEKAIQRSDLQDVAERCAEYCLI